MLWQSGAAMLADRPFFGVGPHRVKTLYPVYRKPGYVLADPGALHNNVVMVAAETGIPSVIAYLAFVAAFFVHAARRAREPGGGIARGALAVMAALFAAGMFEYNFGDVEVLMTTLVVAAMPFGPAPRDA
jgi:O-antigen ligase